MESYYGDLDKYISNEGDGKYKVIEFQKDLSTYGLADRGLTYVSDDMSVEGDEDKVLAEKDGKRPSSPTSATRTSSRPTSACPLKTTPLCPTTTPTSSTTPCR